MKNAPYKVLLHFIRSMCKYLKAQDFWITNVLKDRTSPYILSLYLPMLSVNDKKFLQENNYDRNKDTKNYLVKDSKKDGFCFRSKTNQKINYTEMAREFKEFNSSLTEPDALSMFSIMNTLVYKYVAKGYTVELPFCKIYNRAIGTADDIKSAFTPGVNNNQFVVTMELTPNAKSVITTDVECLQRSPETAGKPVAFYVYPLAKNGTDIKNPDDEKNLSVKHAQALRFHGNNLRCNITDSEQGLFFGHRRKRNSP